MTATTGTITRRRIRRLAANESFVVGAWLLAGLGAAAAVAGTGMDALGTPTETFAVVTGAASVWLLGSNRVSGWWIGIASVVAFIWVFFTVGLYGEVGIQIFYAATSLAAIRLWLRNRLAPTDSQPPTDSHPPTDSAGHERPVRRVPRRIVIITVVAGAAGVAAGTGLLGAAGGAAPFWDALTTVGSLAAHMWLVGRWVESWWIWIALDVIYVPLYLSRGLTLTAGLYVIFFGLAVRGLIEFRSRVEEGDQPGRQTGRTDVLKMDGLGQEAAA